MALNQERKQYHIRLKRGDVGRYVLLTGDPGRVPGIASFFENAKHVATNREYTTYTGEINGIKVSATSTGIGCPSAAICIEELARVGADTFIRIGTAGSLQKHVKVGDLVILTACLTISQILANNITLNHRKTMFPCVEKRELTGGKQ